MISPETLPPQGGRDASDARARQQPDAVGQDLVQAGQGRRQRSPVRATPDHRVLLAGLVESLSQGRRRGLRLRLRRPEVVSDAVENAKPPVILIYCGI